MSKKKTGEHRYSKFVVLLVIALNVLYVCAVLFVNMTGHDVSDSLNYSWFAFTTGELLGLAGMKITETKHGTNMFETWFAEHFGETGKSTDNEGKDDGLEDEAE